MKLLVGTRKSEGDTLSGFFRQPPLNVLPPLKVNQFADGLARFCSSRIGWMAKRRHRQGLNFWRQGEHLASADRIEGANPACPQPQVRRTKGHVVHHDGPIDVGVILAVGPNPCAARFHADDDQNRGAPEPFPPISFAQLAALLGILHNDEMAGLAICG